MRLLADGPPLSLVLTGRVTGFDDPFLTIEGDGFTCIADLDGATFEDKHKLPAFPVCVKVTVRGEARMVRESFKEVCFMICELP